MPQSFLIISPDPVARNEKAEQLLDAAGVDRFDRRIVARAAITSKTDEAKVKASLGIEDVKEMQKTLYLKPLRGKTKAVIITEAHLLTTEAQNALLKVLEEPPEATLIILTAENKEGLLPTIHSRSSLIELKQTRPDLTGEEKENFTEILHSLPEWGVGKSLKEAERLAKNKVEAIAWLEKLILVTRSALLHDLSHTTPTAQTNYYRNLLKRLQETHKTITTTNANLRLILENFFLQ